MPASDFSRVLYIKQHETPKARREGLKVYDFDPNPKMRTRANVSCGAPYLKSCRGSVDQIAAVTSAREGLL